VFDINPPLLHPYFVMGTTIFALLLIVQGVRSDVVLMAASCWLAILGVLDPIGAFKELCSSGILALVTLFPIARAMDETGFMDMAISKLLGQPTSLSVAVFRMMVPVSLLSGLMYNTPVVAMLLPVVVSWAKRLNFHPGKLLMGLSYAAQLGGSITLMGSGTTMMAKESVKNFYDMTFLSPAKVSIAVAVPTCLLVALLSPTSLLQSSAAKHGETEDQENQSIRAKAYQIVFKVQSGGALDGTDPSSVIASLERLCGVISIEPHFESFRYLNTLQGGTSLLCLATAKGAVALRRMRGLELACQHQVNMLGIRRRERNLYECVVSSTGLSNLHSAELRRDFGMALLASRRKGHPSPWMAGNDSGNVQLEDVLLVEADPLCVVKNADRWTSAFALVTPVPHSSPPRNTTVVDYHRAVFTCVGMAMLVLLAGLNVLPLHLAGGIFLLSLILIKAITVEKALGEVKVGVILTIVGASGLASATEKTGVAALVADQLMELAMPGGKYAVYGTIYFLAFFLGMFINNTAVIAMMAPMLPEMQKGLPEEPISAFVYIMLLGAGSCFGSPFGYHTNMMVLPDGGYTFGDFLRFGLTIQFLHGLLTVVIVPLMCKADL
jgi:di/tricarboxylate transporter